MDQAKDGTALLADFASDFGATVEIKSEVAFSPSVPFNKAENEVLNITPSTKRSTTQLSATSPNMPDKKKSPSISRIFQSHPTSIFAFESISTGAHRLRKQKRFRKSHEGYGIKQTPTTSA
jgi:hypothetical protein